MNIRQLRYISEVAKHGLNVSATAESLYTSQPGVSKQIRQLEDELGVQIFERSGRQLTRITPAGQVLIELADRALIEVETIRRQAREFSDPKRGSLSIGASHTQARYVLPEVLSAFHQQYPQVHIELHQGTPLQLAQLLEDGQADFAIATESLQHFDNLVMLPCYNWQRGVLVPVGHPLADGEPLTLERLASYPLLTYVFGFAPGSVIERAFRARKLQPEIALTATDADVLKNYVRLGFGVAVIARMCWTEADRTDLRMIDASHLFDASMVKIGFRRGTFLRRYMYDFLEGFAPHLTREAIDTALGVTNHRALEALFVDAELPLR
ncbi:MAG: HTH-type transcriptional regulator CysB [Gammaproteobacteria bacterium]|nr:HTH-type transcriptional regulator CysB [Gammaproteobacteria bacterium]